MSPLLEQINAMLAKDGRGPGTPHLGDCPAIIDAVRINHPAAGRCASVRLVLDIYSPSRNTLDAVVSFFEAGGATGVEISHVLHDRANDVQNGLDSSGTETWCVDALFPLSNALVSGLLPSAAIDSATAPCILRAAAQAIDDRATLRDCKNGERSMARCVDAFNALTGHDLSETHGWLFMAALKMARATAGGHHLDDHTDHAAYAALAGESAEREANAL